jgi:hypothetical protein
MNNIIRKYNYKLEIGTVGTDDDNIAQIIYAINQMEMYISNSTNDLKELDGKLGKLYFLTVHSKVHLNRFYKIYYEKIKNETFMEIINILDNMIEEIKANRYNENTEEIQNLENMERVFPVVYSKMLDIVPKILALDAQAIGRT